MKYFVKTLNSSQGRRRAGNLREHYPLPFQKGGNEGGGDFFVTI